MASVEMPTPGTSRSRKKTAPKRASTISLRETTQQRQSAISKKKATPEKQHGPQKKRSPLEKSNPRLRTASALFSVQSPPEFRFTDGSPAAEKTKTGNFASAAEGDDKVEMNKLGATDGDNLCSTAEEDFDGFRLEDDSPYRSTSSACDGRLSKIKERASGEPSACLPEKFTSLNECRWGDTSCYGAKEEASSLVPASKWRMGLREDTINFGGRLLYSSSRRESIEV